ncbi:hypothetical protein EVAR_84717_1 [Eumeta japonica]|uniref:Uncharacterized protein n=1 Tax=Eumeta variegata TaxID=151549 RepID=A0A4C1VRR3_EUMVA|nr:hypothetical protein EVAR_84717_1 [Eumeta japonica]
MDTRKPRVVTSALSASWIGIEYLTEKKIGWRRREWGVEEVLSSSHLSLSISPAPPIPSDLGSRRAMPFTNETGPNALPMSMGYVTHAPKKNII